MRKLPLFCAMLLAICLVSCDLLTGPKDDIYKSISDAADWANAPKLAVRIEFPAKWGISSPAQGDITPAMDIRRGYEFSVEFTPDNMYSLQSWKVFRTEDLINLSYPASWVENAEDPGLFDPKKIQPLGPNELTILDFNASARVFKFIINTADPVTLVPWCDTEPRITRTEPRDRPNGQPYSRASDITLYFNGALDYKDESFRFAESETDDGIWITATTDGNVTTNKDGIWFTNLKYAATGGFFTVKIETGVNLPPEESLLTVTVRGIKNAQGNPMAASYSFSWKTSRAANVNFTSYSATYNDNENKIVVTFAQTGADKVVTYYRMDNGNDTPLTTIDKDDTSLTSPLTVNIERVPVLNYSGVRQGRQITGIAEYEIFIELYVDDIMERRTSFKIWNFPGISVDNLNPAIEVINAEGALNPATLTVGLKNLAMKDATKQYVLANDINITGAWNPVGTNTSQFTGKFYGNGRTVTIKGFNAGADDVGLFGVVSGGLVRDLTVEYDDVEDDNVEVNDATNVGGIAGQLIGASVLNCVVKGADGAKTLILNRSDGDACLGGIAGKATNSFIGNCRAGLNVKLNKDDGTGNVGAVAGYINGGSGGNITINIAPPGKANENKTISLLAIDGVTAAADVTGNMSEGVFTIGGAVGASLGNTVRDIVVSGGKVSFDRTAIIGGTRIGGVTGYAENSNMEACSFVSFADKAINGTIDDLKDLYIQLGGLIGCYETNSGTVYINNCLVRGNIEVNEGIYEEERYDSGINIGGVLGLSIYNAGTVNITNTFFEEGTITAACSSGSIQAGGFCGSFYDGSSVQTTTSHYIKNCGVLAGTINIDVRYYGRYIYAGGFTSQIWLKGITSNCFSRANVISKGKGNNDEEGGDIYSYTHHAGGFTGTLAPGSTLTSCYATGFVQSAHNGNRDLSVGGLVGNSGGIINNCYALGNVLADKTGGTSNANAGGLVGSAYKDDSNDSKIQYSFSTGQVIAQSKEGGASAGGIVGSLWDTVLNYTAALGKSVTALGDTRSVGRIIGTDYSITYNYALNTMLIEDGEYNSVDPTTRDSVSNVDGSDGQNTNSTVFFTPSFWSGTLTFSSANWDFSSVGRNGYPRLANVGGQQ